MKQQTLWKDFREAMPPAHPLPRKRPTSPNPVANSFIEHPLWNQIAAHIRLQEARGVRVRFELRLPDQLACLMPEILAMEVKCSSCGCAIHPCRERKSEKAPRAKSAGPVFIALTCEQQVNLSCSRKSAASKERDRVVRALRAIQSADD